MTSINLKIHNFNDNPYTIIPLTVCDDLCSTSVYGSDLWLGRSQKLVNRHYPTLAPGGGLLFSPPQGHITTLMREMLLIQ